MQRAVIVGLGDLFHQYPQLINKDVQRLLGCLADPSLQQTALQVLTHLILNDYLKLKSEVSVFVRLLLCEDQSVVESVRLFFREVNAKNPEFINNTFPEVVRRLSGEISE